MLIFFIPVKLDCSYLCPQVDYGANINVKGNDSLTPLHYAARSILIHQMINYYRHCQH